MVSKLHTKNTTLNATSQELLIYGTEEGGDLLKNLDVRQIVEDSGLKYQRIAEEIGISPEWLSRLMRKELSPENKLRIMDAIGRLKHE